MSRNIQVVQFQRHAMQGNHSVERLFEDVRRELPADIEVKLRINRRPSTGVVGRVADSLAARRGRGAINHILGDVHYLAWFMPRHGTVLTVLDCVALEKHEGVRRLAFWLLWYWWPLRRTSHVTVISEFTRQSLLKWVKYPPDRIHVIHPTLSPEFQPSPPPKRSERLRLLHIGTGLNKNLAGLCEAVQGLPVLLVIVGHIPERDRNLLARLGIAFENHVDLKRSQLLEQYHRADAVAFVSLYEGFGLPIIEAQAVGRPVVTSNVCSMPEAAGGAACLVDPRDVADIRRGVRRLIEEPAYCAELIELGRANAKRYSPDRIAQQYAELYRAIHAEQRGGEWPP